MMSFPYHVDRTGGVTMAATYDAIADWYEDDFLGDRSDDGLPVGDPIGVDSALSDCLPA